MHAPPFDIEPLLVPLPGDQPCGPDLEHDPDFLALERDAAGKPERQYGDKLYPAEPPDWSSLQLQALPLATRTRDLRVAIWLLRSATRTAGLAGATSGLQLVSGLLDTFWASVHPQLDASDNGDPTMRLNALLPLTAADALLADLRGAAVAPDRGSMTLRHLELALTRTEPLADESVPTEAGILQALQALTKRHPGLAEMCRQAHQAAQAIPAQVERQLGAGRGPDFDPLIKLLALPVNALARLQQDPASAPGQIESPVSGVTTLAENVRQPASVMTPGAITSRDDAVRMLDRVCAWIEQNEPSQPAPLLIRRAQRLMRMGFMDIIRDLAPDGLNQVERIAGPDTAS